MIRHQINQRQFILRLATFVLPIMAYGLAGYIRFASGLIPLKSNVEPASYGGLLLVITLVWAFAVEYYQLTSIEGLFASGGKTIKILLACLATHIVVLAFTFFYRVTTFSRLFIWFGGVLLFLSMILMRFMFKVRWSAKNKVNGRSIRLLIVGADDWAVRATRTLIAGQAMPVQVVGYIRLPDQVASVTDAPSYNVNELKNLAQRNGIDDIVIALPPEYFKNLHELLAKLACFCVPIRAILDLGENIAVKDKLFNFGGSLMLDLRPTPAESVDYIVFKRIFDISFSLLVLIVTFPVSLLIALLIYLSDKGPVLFAQERVGFSGNVFRMYKFRTMKCAPESESDTRWTTNNDIRCTTIGSVLRRISLDELPQFLNVLMGQMSVVGPRPERPHFVQQFIEKIGQYNTRHFFKAGITGWAQVNGWRGDTSIEKRVEYDLYYIRHWTLLFDIQIIVLTILRGLANKNAY